MRKNANPKIYQRLRALQKDLTAKLTEVNPDDAAARVERKQAIEEIEAIVKNMAFRLGSDLLDKRTEDLSEEEKSWLVSQVAQMIKLVLSSSIEAKAKDIFHYHLGTLYRDRAINGAWTPAEYAEFDSATSRYKSFRADKDDHFSWKSLAHAGIITVHAGLLAHSASAVLTTSAFLGFWSSLGASIGTGLVWFADQARSALTKASLKFSSLAALKIVGICAYAILMAPLIARTFYKDLRNIILSQYKEKRGDSKKRLLSSLLLAGVGAAIGVVTGMSGLGGGPLVALGLAALGWTLGHSFYKFYKRKRDRKIHFKCTNPQKYHLTHVQWQKLINQKTQNLSTVQEQDARIQQIAANLPLTCDKLRAVVAEQKDERADRRPLLWKLPAMLWNIDLKTKKQRIAESALHALKQADLELFISTCHELGYEVDSASLALRQAAAAGNIHPAEVSVVSAAAVALAPIPTGSSVAAVQQRVVSPPPAYGKQSLERTSTDSVDDPLPMSPPQQSHREEPSAPPGAVITALYPSMG